MMHGEALALDDVDVQDKTRCILETVDYAKNSARIKIA